MTLSIKACLGLAGDLSPISDSPLLDCQLLLCEVLQQQRVYLYTWPEKQLSQSEYEAFLQMLARRKAGEPIAYILGRREFWSLDLQVSPDTLIPRPDTETLVEKALTCIDEQYPAKVLDLGTGTGAIALALATERPHWHITGVDQSEPALAIALSNQTQLAISNVRWLKSNWYQSIPKDKYHLILSNPPYIDKDDQHLQEGDVRFEPNSALVAADRGLADIKTIIQQAHHYLHKEAWLILEHGYQQAEAVAELLQQAGFIDCFKQTDLGGNIRISGARSKGASI